jgi:hypothetical protein
MYVELFQAQTRAIAELEGVEAALRTTTDALRAAQQATEEMFIEAEPVLLDFIKRDQEEEKPDGSE